MDYENRGQIDRSFTCLSLWKRACLRIFLDRGEDTERIFPISNRPFILTGWLFNLFSAQMAHLLPKQNKNPPAQTNKGDLLTNNKSHPLLRGGSRYHSGRRSDFTAGGTVPEFHLACFPFKLPSAQINLSLVVPTIPDALKKSQWNGGCC